MGDQADDILMLFKLSSEEMKNYDTIEKKFDSHFVPQHNVIFERAKLNQRKQQTWCKHVTFALNSGETKRNQWSLLQPQKDLNWQHVGTDLFQWENKQYMYLSWTTSRGTLR